MSLPADQFWRQLESSFPLGGARRRLNELLGEALTAALIAGGVLKYRRVAETYPCAHREHPGCPMRVIDLEDGSYQVVCGNDPSECADLRMSEDDVRSYAVDPIALCDAMRLALQIRSKPAPVANLPNAFQVGVFRPEPDVSHDVFFVSAADGPGYARAIDVLVGQQGGATFAVLVPSLEIIPDDTILRMERLGTPVATLDNVVEIDASGRLVSLVDGSTLFREAGNRFSSPAPRDEEVVADAYLDGKWTPLSRAQLEALRADAGSYEIFADQITNKVVRGFGDDREDATAINAHFEMVRAAIAKAPRNFDPARDDPSEKPRNSLQAFQRSRKEIDLLRSGQGNAARFALMNRVESDGNTHYRFDPEPGLHYALIFYRQD
jgi:hypothetical protein